jgi:amino-acid N-acetyltransferase
MDTASADSAAYARWFRASTPYISKHRGKTFVVMLGGDGIEHTNLVNIIHDLALLSVLGVRVVLVHGARPQIDRALAARSLTSEYAGHRRITDASTLEVVKATVALVRSAIEGWFSTGIPNTPLHKARVRVLSGNLVTAKPLGVIDGVDHGHTGRVRRVDANSIAELLNTGALVLISPLAHSPSGQAFNLSAEELAADVAASVKADKLIMLDRSGRLGISTVPGTDHAFSELTPRDVDALLSETELDPVTRLRVTELLRTVRAGVDRAHLVSFADDGALLEELFTAAGSGTQISEQEFRHIRPAGIEDVAGIAELIRPIEVEGALVQRPRERLEQEIDRFLVAELDGIIIGCCAVYPYAVDNIAELACLATHPAYRSQSATDESLGDRLLRKAESQARDAGLDTLFALTTQAREWFLERGFNDAAVTDLPKSQQQIYNHQRGSHVVLKRLNKHD